MKTQTLNLVYFLCVCVNLKLFICVHTYTWEVPSDIFRYLKFEVTAVRISLSQIYGTFFFLSLKYLGLTDHKIQKDATLCRILMAGVNI